MTAEGEAERKREVRAMSERVESISVEVFGANPDELIWAARSMARQFWGSDYGTTVGDIHARPHVMSGSGVVSSWVADVHVTRVPRPEPTP